MIFYWVSFVRKKVNIWLWKCIFLSHGSSTHVWDDNDDDDDDDDHDDDDHDNDDYEDKHDNNDDN